MKFSIITPCSERDANKLTLLAQNLNDQTNLDFEWIIASNNDKLNLPKTNFTTKVVKFTGNTVADARNKAMKIASGDYFVFVDADDFLTEDAIDAVSKILPQSDDSIIDLNYYYTYETENAYFNELKLGKHANDVLPDWGGKKKARPTTRNFNYLSQDVNKMTDDLLYQNWLNNRYWVYSGNNHFDRMYADLIVSGKVIASSLIERFNLIFDAENDLYADLMFMLSVLDLSKQIIRLADYKYILTLHNDPINDPSLSQVKRSDRWIKMISSWIMAYSNLKNAQLKLMFGQHSIRTLHRFFYKAVIEDSDNISNNDDKEFELLQEYLQLLDSEAFSEINPISRSIMKSIEKGNFPKAKKLMKSLIATRQVHKIVKKRGKNLPRAMYEKIYTKREVKNNVILFESFLGRNYSDSPKYIYEYIQKHYPNRFKCVWIADEEHMDTVKNDLKDQPNTIVVKRFGFKYMEYLATAKYFVFNMRQPEWFVKRPGMYFLETWHGTPLKRLVFDMDNVASASHLYKKTFYNQSRQWDNLVTANQYSYDIFEHAFMYPQSKMLKSGYPRNDILNDPNRDEIAKRIKQKLGIPLDKKVILYAPTWRDNQFFSPGHYKFSLTLDIANLRKHLSDDYVMVLRTHYFITNHLDTSSFGDFVYNESNYDDIAELYLISDVLITDYSSVFFDYAILKRPILYYVYDYDQYASALRGFYIDMKTDLPGPLLKTNDDVLNALQGIDNVKKEYKEKYEKFNQRFNAWDDGHASARVVNKMFKNDENK